MRSNTHSDQDDQQQQQNEVAGHEELLRIYDSEDNEYDQEYYPEEYDGEAEGPENQMIYGGEMINYDENNQGEGEGQ